MINKEINREVNKKLAEIAIAFSNNNREIRYNKCDQKLLVYCCNGLIVGVTAPFNKGGIPLESRFQLTVHLMCKENGIHYNVKDSNNTKDYFEMKSVEEIINYIEVSERCNLINNSKNKFYIDTRLLYKNKLKRGN